MSKMEMIKPMKDMETEMKEMDKEMVSAMYSKNERNDGKGNVT